MTVLVTGARGDVGGAVLAGLLAAGEPVRASSRAPRCQGPPLTRGPFLPYSGRTSRRGPPLGPGGTAPPGSRVRTADLCSHPELKASQQMFICTCI